MPSQNGISIHKLTTIGGKIGTDLEACQGIGSVPLHLGHQCTLRIMMTCSNIMSRKVEKQELEENQITMLRQMRENAGLTREQLVGRMDNVISVATLSRWENYGMEPSLSRRGWHLFCTAVNIPFEELPMELSALVAVA